MGHESNPDRNIGSNNPNKSYDDFRRAGMGQDHAAAAAAAAQRARQGK